MVLPRRVGTFLIGRDKISFMASATFKTSSISGGVKLSRSKILWCCQTAVVNIASGAAGDAISYGLGQGATMVAAIWGVFIWKEFAQAPKGTNKLLALMFLFFVTGLVLIILAKTI